MRRLQMLLDDGNGALAVPRGDRLHELAVLGVVGGDAFRSEDLVLDCDPMAMAADAVELMIDPHQQGIVGRLRQGKMKLLIAARKPVRIRTGALQFSECFP